MLGGFLVAGVLAAEEGFVSIFDGESLDGWKGSPDNPEAFSVELDGTLKVSGKRAHLYYQSEGDVTFRNFELKLKVKTTQGSNSGVYFATQYQEKGWPEKGYEAQVNSSQRDQKRSGSLYGVVNLWVDETLEQDPFVEVKDGAINLHIKEAVTKDDEWFEYHIIVQDLKITLKIDGETTVEFTEPEGWEGPNDGMRGRKLSAGTIAIQAHDPKSTVFYKDISLKIND